MRSKHLILGFLILAFTFSSCRFTLDESDYVGHYEGTYRLANFVPYEGTAIMDIIPVGNDRYDIMFCANGWTDSAYYYNWEVDRYSGGLYGPYAWIHSPGAGQYGYSEVYVSKVDHRATVYLEVSGTDTIEANFSGDRIY